MKDINDCLPMNSIEIMRSSGWDRKILVKDLSTYDVKELHDFQRINYKHQYTPIAYLGDDSWLLYETDQYRYGCDRGLKTDTYRVMSPIEIIIEDDESHTLNKGWAYSGDIIHFFRGGPGYEEQLQVFHVHVNPKNLRYSYVKNENEEGWFFVDAQPRRSCRKRNYQKIFGKKISDGGYSTRHSFRLCPYKENLVGEKYNSDLYDSWED